MSAKWIRVETDFVDHPKVFQLCQMLNDPNAVAYVLRFWSFISKFYPEGRIEVSRSVTRDVTLASRVTAIVTACRWKGDGELFIAALIDCGFLDEIENGFEAHDWTIHQGKVASSAEKARVRAQNYRARLKEASRTVTRDVTLASRRDEIANHAQRDVTGRDVTGRDVRKEEEPPVVEKMRELWNTHKAPEQPEWKKSKGKDPRASAARARYEERSPVEHVEIMRRIATSGFCCGLNDRGWRADPDWWLKPGTAAKVLEGKYDNRTGRTSTNSTYDPNAGIMRHEPNQNRPTAELFTREELAEMGMTQ